MKSTNHDPEQLDHVGRLVQSLPDDMPNMAWRAQLSDRLAQESQRVQRRQNWFRWVIRPGFAVAATTALVMVVAVRISTSSAPSAATFESEVLQAQQQVLHESAVTTGLSLAEMERYAVIDPTEGAEDDWEAVLF